MLIALTMLAGACADDGSTQSTAPPVTSAEALATSTTTAPESTLGPSTTAGPQSTLGSEIDPSFGSGPSAADYYLAVGDSYAVGYLAGIGPSSEGFADRVVESAAESDRPLQLVNVGCSGATTASMIDTLGCDPAGLAPGAAAYGSTQLDAALAFLEAHPGRVELITVSIGGNDVFPCALAGGGLVECTTTAIATATTNLVDALDRIRAAAPDAQIIGTTYPNVALGAWTTAIPGGRERAVESIGAFRDVINPALRGAYESVGGVFVDVTEATGGYGSMDTLTVLEPYGEIPAPVAQVCELTAFCSSFDIHPNAEGYELIADLIVAEFRSSTDS